ncbi:CDP-alcohol phosphatidyltransferase family protein [Thermodesulforhabdus norvegica]|uniref:CDP-alcohol phosphatidyltransferase n=1 Tax=Thermodesulforhabdus norvegica TaxID=39841 RepID=A0A1I4SJT3_9BACT|nr:CDP-alcohol phosphatidyltransferase family protein [Thermodesulforhabdus norvegica]SFM64600.1 CDP-alcohol phosphatidyltransferase [Thermodesulforhabdus norvegica]
MTEAVIVDTGRLVKIDGKRSLPAMYVRLGGISLLRRQVEALKAAGFNRVVFISRESAENIDRALNRPTPVSDGDFCFRVVNYGDYESIKNLASGSSLIVPSDMFLTVPLVRLIKGGMSEKPRYEGPIIFIRTREDVERVEEYLYQSLFSPTDSFLTRKINRKVSIAITRRLSSLPLHPNHITIFNFILGVTGGLLLFCRSHTVTIIGTLLFLLSSILDGCDGELARLRYQRSRFGGLLDVVTDNIVHWVVFSGLTYRSVTISGFLPYGVLGLSLIFSSIAAFLFSLYASTWGDRGCRPSAGLLFSESPLSELSPDSGILDRIANRDFAYLLVVLSILGRLEWFLLVGGFGAPIFAFLLFRSLKLRGVL